MLLVLSPAKSLELKKSINCALARQPILDGDKKPIVSQLKKWKANQIAEVLGLSDKLAELNYQRYQALGTKESLANTRQAIFTFDGEVYTGFDAYSLAKKQFEHTEKTVRILSGLYGVLNPFDLIEPYRLEMGTALKVGKAANLYQFWGSRIAQCLNEQLAADKTPVVVNLASQEYFKAVDTQALQARVIECVFEDWKDGRYKIISFFAKRARGLMCRWAITHRARSPKALRAFDLDGYAFDPQASTDARMVFRRRTT